MTVSNIRTERASVDGGATSVGGVNIMTHLLIGEDGHVHTSNDLGLKHSAVED